MKWVSTGRLIGSGPFRGSLYFPKATVLERGKDPGGIPISARRASGLDKNFFHADSYFFVTSCTQLNPQFRQNERTTQTGNIEVQTVVMVCWFSVQSLFQDSCKMKSKTYDHSNH